MMDFECILNRIRNLLSWDCSVADIHDAIMTTESISEEDFFLAFVAASMVVS